jgi:ribosomal-protein-alanine N-acetyltransferase
MTHKGTITLETERLILRRFTPEDAEPMSRNWANDPEVTKYLTWLTHTDVSISKAVIDSWVPLYEQLDHYSWAIELKSLAEPIGSIAAVEKRDDIRMVHIGYCIGKAWWRQGYTSEALIRLVRFFFEKVGVNRIESRHDPCNPNSGKVMMKAGLKYEGTLRQADINNQGGFCDAAYSGLGRGMGGINLWRIIPILTQKHGMNGRKTAIVGQSLFRLIFVQKQRAANGMYSSRLANQSLKNGLLRFYAKIDLKG